MNELTDEVIVEEIDYMDDSMNFQYVLTLKVGFFGRLTFLFKGSKVKFCIPLTVLKNKRAKI